MDNHMPIPWEGKVNRNCLVLICSIAIAAFCIGAFGLTQNRPNMSGTSPGNLITVLNPAVASKMAERIPLSPRLDNLEEKTIYMVDINWGGPEAALSIFEEIQDWFSRNMPNVRMVIKLKKGGYDADDPALWKEIHENNGDAVILGVSG
jgi:hypothetical protein